MSGNEAEFGRLLDRLDLHQIEKLKLSKQAVTFLEGKRRQLVEQIGAVDQQMAQLKAGTLDPRQVLPAPTPAKPAPAPTGGGRRREGSLPTLILNALKAKPNESLSAQQIADAVLAAGYQTGSKDFIQSVRVAIGKLDGLESVERGIYRLKPSAPAA
jgi:hypothetical protein